MSTGSDDGARFDGLEPLMRLLAEQISDHQMLRYTADIWSTDRWFTSEKWMQTHQYTTSEMARAGADEVEIVRIPSDGQTKYENWIMPMAFDCEGARVELIDPDYELLADWTQVPQCVVQWSAPTPPEGITAEVVDAETLDPEKAGAAKGKIVLTSKNPGGMRRQLETWEAAAVVTYWLRDHITDRTATCWVNSFSKHPGGWGVLADDPSLPGFVLSPVVGQKLARRLADGQKLKLRVWADTRLHEGVLPVSTGVIRGADAEQEVVLFGHAAEVGADDNCSGCAVMMEAIRVLARLIGDGQLHRPRRSMRVILTAEIYGMLGFSGNHDALSRAIAGLHFDLVGDAAVEGREITMYEQSPTNASYVNELVMLIRDAMPQSLGGSGLPFVRKAYSGVADDMVGDPAFGVPCPWMGRPIKNNPYYHSSGDTLHTIDPVAMRWHAGLAAAYLYFLASAGDAEAGWLADRLIERARAEWVAEPSNDAQWLGNYARKAACRRTAELCQTDRAAQAIRTKVDEALPGFDEPVKDLDTTPASGDEALVVGRVTRGVLKFDGQPFEMQQKWGGINWSTSVASALYWADGQRNIAQLRRLAQAEWGEIKTDLVALFKAAAEARMILLHSKE